MMQFYAKSIRSGFPELTAAVLRIDGITATGNVSIWTAHYSDIARSRLGNDTEASFPEVQAWRRAFAKMGLKPTQYRCASEALLRRFRKEGSLPAIHPLVDLCNVISMAFGIPIAVFDLQKIAGDLEVRYADGSERYETFSGEIERPDAGEVIMADSQGNAHARRWVNRQSGLSAVRAATTSALLVAESMHEGGAYDLVRLSSALRTTVAETWPHANVHLPSL